jgi:hypothetical protein
MRSTADLPPITDEDYALLSSFFDSTEPDTAPSEPQPEGFSVPRPPEWEYRLGYWDQLVAAASSWSKDYGFMTSLKGTDDGHWKVGNVILTGKRRGSIQCARSGTYRGHGKRTGEPPSEDVKTRKTNCPFLIHYTIDPKNGQEFYVLREDLKSFCLSHNHAPDDPAIFYQYRRLTGAALDYALDLTSRMSPASILGTLQAKFGRECCAVYDDIRNLQQRTWAKERRGMKSTEAMLTVLQSVKMSARYWLDPKTAELLGVLISDPMAMVLAHRYGRVLQMDCTYKTNKYNMPMLHITSHVGTNNTFTVAICFMRQETTADYTRAIQELRKMLPDLPTKTVVTDAETALAAALRAAAPEWKQILCRWHIGQNILTTFKRKMSHAEWKVVLRDWRNLINARSVSDFEYRLELLRTTYSCKTYGRKLVEYIQHRLRPGQREKIVSCYIDDYSHFDQTSSSRAESGHSQLKSQLMSCRGDLFMVVKVFRSGMFLQQSKILHNLRIEKSLPPAKKSQTFFREVSSCVHIL